MRRLRSGSLLVARPPLQDENFRQAVILLFRHDAKAGSMGLVVNRKSDMKVSRFAGQIPGAEEREDSLWIGGPVQQNSIWVLHRRADLDDHGLEIAPGMFLGGSPNLLRDLMLLTVANPAPSVFRVVQGYAGWGEGQLLREINEGAWHIADADADLIFNTVSEDLWDDVLTRAQLPFRLPADALRNARHN